jgi:hypothetical protein
MIRKLFLLLAILAVLVTPRPAHGRGGGGNGHNHSHHRGHHFVGVIYAPFPYGSRAGRKMDSGSISFTWTDMARPPTCPSGCRPTGGCWY